MTHSICDLSVIIPTFRREEPLADAVASVLAEDVDRMEVLVIDDSPEGSAESVVSGIDDPRVRYLPMPEPTGGRPALVRNHGLALAAGEVLYFLDDDDCVAPGGLRAFLDAFERAPDRGVAFGGVVCVGPDRATREQYTRWFDWAAKTSGRLRRSSWLTVGTIMFRGTLIINSCCAIRRSLAIELAGYDPAIEVYEDVEFFTRGIRRAGHVVVDQPVLRYTTGLPSIIHDLDGDNSSIESSYVEMQSKYRKEHGTLEFQLLRVVARLLPLGRPT